MTQDIIAIHTDRLPVTGYVVEHNGASLTVPCEPWEAHVVTVQHNARISSSRLFTTAHEAKQTHQELAATLRGFPDFVPYIGSVSQR